MPGEDQVLRDAYRYFQTWGDDDKARFEELLAQDVVWVEVDPDLDPKTYRGKPAVMGHVNDIKQALVRAELDPNSVQQKGAFWETKDTMEAQGHQQHECVTHITFDSGLITQVRHCVEAHP